MLSMSLKISNFSHGYMNFCFLMKYRYLMEVLKDLHWQFMTLDANCTLYFLNLH